MRDDAAEPVPLAARAEPVLSYATKDADGLPEWVAEAEKLIEQRSRPRAIRKFFRHADETVKYFAKSMRRRFGPDSLGARCVACEREPAAFALQVAWSASCPPRILEFRVSEKEIAATFQTLHALCESCLGDWGRRLTSYSIPRRWLARGMGIVTVLFIGLLLLGRISALNAYVPRRLNDVAVGFYIASLLLLGVANRLTDLLWRVRHPRVLRRLMPRDVRILGVSGAFARDEDGVLRSLPD